ncbi:hypothetical protein CIB84_002235, partial [Bambusicola thoracicus]
EQQEPQLISITLAAIQKNPNESRLKVEMAFSHFNTEKYHNILLLSQQLRRVLSSLHLLAYYFSGFMRHFITRITNGRSDLVTIYIDQPWVNICKNC